MEIFGPSLEAMIRRGGHAARHMRYSVRLVVLALARDVHDAVPSADDLMRAQAYWEHQIDKVLQPDVRSALLYGGDVIRRALKDDDIPQITNPYVEWYLLTTRNRLSGVGNIVWETARQQLLDGMALGEDIDALRNRIRKTTGLTTPRAETVARTETMGAMNAGSLIQMQSAGVPFKKTWLATAGPRTRPTHARADGQTVKGDAKFTVGGWPMDRPHDPSAPAEETENCRCTMTFEVRETKTKKKAGTLETLLADAGGAEIVPWHKVKNHSECPDGQVAVVKDSDGSVAGCHASEAAADKQLAALYANEGKSIVQSETSSCGCSTSLEGGAIVRTTDVSSDGGGAVTEVIDRTDEELAAKPGQPGQQETCPEGERWDPIQRKCVEDTGMTDATDESLGGKPNPGTEKDDRLRKNKIKTRDRKHEGETVDFAVDSEVAAQDDGYWEGVLAVEGIPTGDGREFSSGALTWADTPFPIRWNKEDSHGGEPHTVAVNVGRADHAWRDPEQSHIIRGSGVFNLQTEDGKRAHQMVKDGFLSGISIDPDNITDADVEYVWAEKPEGSEEDEGEDLLKMLFGRPEKIVFHAGRIRAATLVDIPAFVEAKVQLADGPIEPPVVAEPALTAGAVGTHVTPTTDSVWDGPFHDRRFGDRLALPAAKLAYAYVDETAISEGQIPKISCSFLHHEVAADGTVGPANLTACSSGIGVLFGGRGGTNLPEVARRGIYAHLAAHLRDAGQEPPPYRDETAAGLVAGGGDAEWLPPREWFSDPKLGQLTPILVTDDGRVYGHACQWGECHIGPTDGTCITAPREQGHPYFMTGEIVTTDGSRVAVGQIYTRANHADLFMGPASATRHYENTGYVVADVAVGNDRHGIWVAGAVRGDALATRVNELRASGQVSPDWRRIGGQLRMIGMLVVNVSGYQVPRPRASTHNGEIRTLVAAGIPQIGAGAALRAEEAARAAELEAEQLRFRRELAELDQLVHGGRD